MCLFYFALLCASFASAHLGKNTCIWRIFGLLHGFDADHARTATPRGVSELGRDHQLDYNNDDGAENGL